jgi:hypothetical protein
MRCYRDRPRDGAEVLLLSRGIERLQRVDQLYRGRIMTSASTTASIELSVAAADLVLGPVFRPGGRAPVLVGKDLVRGHAPRLRHRGGGRRPALVCGDHPGDDPRRPGVPGPRHGTTRSATCPPPSRARRPTRWRMPPSPMWCDWRPREFAGQPPRTTRGRGGSTRSTARWCTQRWPTRSIVRWPTSTPRCAPGGAGRCASRSVT